VDAGGFEIERGRVGERQPAGSTGTAEIGSHRWPRSRGRGSGICPVDIWTVATGVFRASILRDKVCVDVIEVLVLIMEWGGAGCLD
jgi:hypothetical protein